jgi:hypothetical protein
MQTVKSFIFSNALDKKRFNSDEQLQLLLFETLLFTYIRKQQKPVSIIEFTTTLLSFYKGYNGSNLLDRFKYKTTSPTSKKLEIILASRVGIKSSFLGANYWLKHLSNAFIFLDVILFRAFLEGDDSPFLQKYERYTSSVLNGLIYGAHINDKVEEKEKKILQLFIASAALPKAILQMYKERSKIGIKLKVLQQELVADHLLAQITYEFGHLLLQSTHLITAEDRQKLEALGSALHLNTTQLLNLIYIADNITTHIPIDVIYLNNYPVDFTSIECVLTLLLIKLKLDNPEFLYDYACSINYFLV